MMVARSARNPAGSRPVDAWGIAALLFVLTALLFARATANRFVNYDDPDYVTANAHVRAGLSPAGARWAFTATAASNWHPLTWLSHMADVSLFGKNPTGHHATSVLLHAFNAVLAFAALRRLTRATWTSAVAAAWFAWHPLRVESVAWVAERKDVLSSLFFLAALWTYAIYVERRQRPGAAARRAYLCTVALFICGLLAKPMLVTLPCVLLLLDVWPLQRWSFGRTPPSPDARAASPGWLVAEKAPFFALSLASCIVTYLAQSRGGAVTAALTLGQRLANAVVAVARYLGVVAWPSNLAVLYPHPGNWPIAAVASSTLLLASLGWFAWRERRRRPWLLIGGLWFAGMLVPVLGVVQVGLQSMADRYTYLPVLGLECAVLWTAREFLLSAGGAGLIARSLRRGAGAAIALGLGACAMLTFQQIGVWKDSLTLFTHTIAVAGRGNYLAYDNRGIAWGDRGENDKAVADYQQALAINPTYPNANNNLGRVLADRGQIAAAIAHYETALKSAPGMLEVHNNLANALADAGRIEEAIEHYQYVLKRQPDHLNARNGYGVALASKGNLTAAEREFRRVLEIDPDNASAISNLGNVCAILGRRKEARRLFERSLALHPDDARTRYNLGNVLGEDGRWSEAVDQYLEALRVAPINPDAHAALGGALLHLNRPQEAIPQLELALQQRPNFPQARQWLDAARQSAARR